MSEEGELSGSFASESEQDTTIVGDEFVVLSETGEMTILGRTHDSFKRKSVLTHDGKTPKKLRLDTLIEEDEDWAGSLNDKDETLRPRTRDIGLSPIVVASTSALGRGIITSTPVKKCDGCSKVPGFMDQITDYFKQITDIQKLVLPPILEDVNDKKMLDDKKDDDNQDENEATEEPGKEEPVKNHLSTSIYHTSQQFITENIHMGSTERVIRQGLRPIVIDGSNIALGHGQNKVFSVRGLKICIDFFLKRGHKVYAFIPSYRMKRNQSDNQSLLMQLVDQQLVFCTSSREVFGKKICSYDDRILLQAAAAMKAIVVSRDNYRDLLAENPRRLGPTIERGLLMPTWVGDMIIFPEDPLGRFGPNLERFLRYP